MPSRIEIVRWIAENKRPFAIVKDQGFVDLMKTGRPMYRLPSPATVARDVKHVFVSMRSIIATKLKVSTYTELYYSYCSPDTEIAKAHDGCLNFGTDAWTSPNGQAFVAVTVHYETNGLPLTLLLDIMKCARSHTGSNLASTFEKILREFGISDKV